MDLEEDGKPNLKPKPKFQSQPRPQPLRRGRLDLWGDCPYWPDHHFKNGVCEGCGFKKPELKSPEFPERASFDEKIEIFLDWFDKYARMLRSFGFSKLEMVIDELEADDEFFSPYSDPESLRQAEHDFLMQKTAPRRSYWKGFRKKERRLRRREKRLKAKVRMRERIRERLKIMPKIEETLKRLIDERWVRLKNLTFYEDPIFELEELKESNMEPRMLRELEMKYQDPSYRENRIKRDLLFHTENFIRRLLLVGVEEWSDTRLLHALAAYVLLLSESTERQVAEESNSAFPEISRKTLRKWASWIQRFEDAEDEIL